MKTCKTCNIEKPFTDFHKRSCEKDGLAVHCKACVNAKQKTPERRAYLKAWGQTEIGKRSIKNEQLKKQYGITLNEWEALFESQGRCCACCFSENPRLGKWDTDHIHGTKIIRGIVCHGCNVIFGQAEDNPSIAYRAYLYLQKHQGEPTGPSVEEYSNVSQ